MLSGVILAGGPNRRMGGENKAFLLVDNKTIVERQIREMKKGCSEIIIVTNDPAPFMKTVDRSIRIITDYIPGKGPLSGMHAGLTLAKNRNVWVVGCDMPFISIQAAMLLLEKKEEGVEAVIPFVNHISYPFHGVFDKSCVLHILALLDQGEQELSRLLKTIVWRELSEAEFHRCGIDCRFVKSIDTRHDYDELAAWFESVKNRYLRMEM
ncbi:molybdenum cofactor guanylyltransferase [Paenibacillus hamazuiensis]|uniref:molybdenum cofactor guanylyltransferase n=1 Tax=Paenibacillus hamazuiensis TaxID=2936508 RepID=UPI00200DE0CF|nr:molybdenum cofactor guanylyltransferase [Paenibacillus hamazuiensis]